MIYDQKDKEFLLRLSAEHKSRHLLRFILESVDLSTPDTINLVKNMSLNDFRDLIASIPAINVDCWIGSLESFIQRLIGPDGKNSHHGDMYYIAYEICNKILYVAEKNKQMVEDIFFKIMDKKDIMTHYQVCSSPLIIKILNSTKNINLIEALISNYPMNYYWVLDNPIVPDELVEKVFAENIGDTYIVGNILRGSRCSQKLVDKINEYIKITRSNNHVVALIESGRSDPESIKYVLKLPYNKRVDYLCRIAYSPNLSDDAFNMLVGLRYIDVKRILAKDGRTPTKWVDEEIKNHKLINTIRNRDDLTDTHKKKIEELDVIKDILE